MKNTPLYDWHCANGGKMVSFAGWQMPIQYEMGIRGEHQHARSKVGLFDVSHMGEIRVRGPQSLSTLQWLTTNDVSVLKAGEAQYSLFPNKSGGVVDDLIVYCLVPGEDYLLCVNAANTDKDFAFLTAQNPGAEITNESSKWGQIAIQGPGAPAILEALCGSEFASCKSFHFLNWAFEGQSCLVAKTGYTGEPGGEIFVPWDATEALWKTLINSSEGAVAPIGLAARDTLRTEMKYSLYGQEITDSTNPYSAGLGWVVKPQAKDFLGKDVMVAEKNKGLERKLVGLQIHGRGIARQGYRAFSFDNEEIGEVTSGTLSPSLNKAIAIAFVRTDLAAVGTRLFVEIRNKMVEAEVVKTPFYKS